MASPFVGILGQEAPAAATNIIMYTVPAGRRAVSSSLIVCETNGADTLFRIYAGKAGAVAAKTNAMFYDIPLAANSSYAITVGLAFAATDTITVYSLSGNATFTLLGEESTVPA